MGDIRWCIRTGGQPILQKDRKVQADSEFCMERQNVLANKRNHEIFCRV